MGSTPHMSILPEWVDFIADKRNGIGVLKGFKPNYDFVIF